MQAGDVVTDRFDIEEQAGAGGMGAVWRAKDRLTGEGVALKVLHATMSAASDRFTREGRILAELRHPGIVRYIAHGTTPSGELFIAMDWLEGEDLRKRLAREGLTVSESVLLARCMADALGAVHVRGIVHRDIKPSNIFLPRGEIANAKLLDFGVARVGSVEQAQTMTGVIVGTPGYMAPEQARADRDLDARVDVFALGCVLFACLTGRAPFVGENIVAVLAKILLEDPPRVRELRPEVPAALDDLVLRLMANDRQRRPADGNVVAAELALLGEVTLDDQVAAPVAVHAAALTGSEQRYVSIVVCAAPPGQTSAPTALTATGRDASLHEQRLDAAVAPFGARLERLMNGTLIAAVTGKGGATDLAAQAARCALALRAHMPDAPIVLATGRGVLAARLPVGEVIDRAATMLVDGPSMPSLPPPPGPRAARRLRPILMDEVTAGLLDARFEVVSLSGALALVSEREATEVARTLLGKPTPCVGRDRELGVLGGLFDECVGEPRARAVLVTGAAGIGKSRLRHEFVKKVGAREVKPEVWIGRGDPMSAGSPFGLLGRAIRRAAGVQDGEALDARRKKLRARIARNVGTRDLARVTQFLGELVGIPSEEESIQLRAARQDARLMGDQMLVAFQDFLAAECASHPVVLVFEDLHWGDLPTVSFVSSALKSLADSPLLVLALARPEVHDIFPELWAERGLQEVRLGEITKKSAEKLAREVLGALATPDLVARVVDRAAGNAFYLEELIRAVAEGKEAALPETVLAMVEARLERLEPEARRVLRAASVFGQTFWHGGVVSLLGESPGEWLRVLTDREVVTVRSESTFPEEREFVFRHAIVREAAYAMLTNRDRTLGHKLAAEWLTGAGGADAVLLAEHFERGGEPSRAVSWYRRAAEEALAGNDLRAVIVHAERGVACGIDGETLGSLRLLQAEAHRWRGEQADAEKAALEAFRSLPRGSVAWFFAAAESCAACSRLGNDDALDEIGRETLELTAKTALNGPRIIALARMVQHLQHARRQHLGDAMLEKIDEATAVVDGDPAVAGRVFQAKAFRAHMAGDPGIALRYREVAVQKFAEAGDERNLIGSRLNLGHAYLHLGAFALAESALEAAADVCVRLELHYMAATAKNNLGLALALQGRLDEALAVESEALVALKRQGDLRMEGGSRIRLAIIHTLAARFDDAEREAALAHATLPAASTLHAYALAVRSRALLLSGNPSEALAAAEDACARLTAQGGWAEEGESLVRLARAEALDAAGDRVSAKAALADAHARLTLRAQKIDDPAWRESFLEKIPEHARTRELACAWGVG